MPRSSRSKICSSSSGGFRNVTPSNEVIGSIPQSVPIVAWPVAPGGCWPGHNLTPSCAATAPACDRTLAVKLWTALGTLEMLSAASVAVARQYNAPVDGRSIVGMKPVSLTPSVFVPLVRIDAKVGDVLISKKYVIAPVAPMRVAFVTRSAGRACVVAPVSGAIGTGALTTIEGPIVNLKAGPKIPVVPPPV